MGTQNEQGAGRGPLTSPKTPGVTHAGRLLTGKLLDTTPKLRKFELRNLNNDTEVRVITGVHPRSWL